MILAGFRNLTRVWADLVTRSPKQIQTVGPIRRQFCIGGNQRPPVTQGLPDDHAIEWIFVGGSRQAMVGRRILGNQWFDREVHLNGHGW
jgi:hypothetical protein